LREIETKDERMVDQIFPRWNRLASDGTPSASSTAADAAFPAGLAVR